MKDVILNYILILLSLLIISSSCNKPNDIKEEELPIIMTLDITDISTTTAFSGISISGDTSKIEIFGICWDTIPNPTFSDNCITSLHILKTSYKFMMRDLVHSTKYFVKAYAIVGKDTIYGDEKSFKTAFKEEELPIIMTLDITDISTTTAFSGISISGDTSKIEIFGICWGTIPNPTFSDNRITWPYILKRSYKFMMRDLMHSTKYFVKAYAIVGKDTIYGDEKRFKTADTFIGDNYQGGIVAYIFKPDDPGYVEGEIHGLVISPENLVTHDKYHPYFLTPLISWDDESISIITGATGQAIGSGNSNTNTIVSVLGIGSYAYIPRFYAARLCYDLVLNGYSDWYLPSIVELESILVNRSKLQLSTTYWSSTEISSGTALILTFYEQGTVSVMSKGYHIFVRAVRTF